MALLPVAEALERLFALAPLLGTETVPLTRAAGRVLRADAVAGRDQPPFAAAAMDGYAVTAGDHRPGAVLKVVGEAAAGRRWDGRLAPGQAVRILTGAPVPDGAAAVVIQENAARDGDLVTLADMDGSANIRPAGADFRAGDRLAAPRPLTPADVALMAAMNCAEVTVAVRPEVAILATGDELVSPGEDPGPDQILASNSYGLYAMLRAAGARPRLLPIAGDTTAALAQAFDLARGADLIVTIGGASVGDHDLVARAVIDQGGSLDFHRVAIRPGKPLMAGRLGAAMLLGLPGNPVSAMVCGEVFLRPLIDAMQGLPRTPRATRRVPLAAALPPNGPRDHYLRARLTPGGALPFDRQDSSLLSVLSQADCLIVQPAGDPGRAAGDSVDILRI